MQEQQEVSQGSPHKERSSEPWLENSSVGATRASSVFTGVLLVATRGTAWRRVAQRQPKPQDGVMQAVFPFLNGFKADESWIYRCPDDLPKMFLRFGTEKAFQGHECFIPGEPGAARFKWGRCVWHRERAMRPYIVPNGEHQGKLILICSAFFSEDNFFCRGCFFKMPFPWHRYKELKEYEKSEYSSLKLSFGRGSLHP